MKSIDNFRKSLNGDQPPEGLTELLKALWWDAKGNWKRAHETAQDIPNANGAWVHAYLHRKEGNEGNADYWYSRAGKPKCRKPLNGEWDQIVNSFLKNE